MAGSDKNARHSVAGGNPTQSSQPVSEAEGRQVDGQMMNSLPAGTAARPALSHEAKLGMMVITILIVAFGFLVYHKMDLHQRQLTQASIPSTAEDGVNLAEPSESSESATDDIAALGVAADFTGTDSPGSADAVTPVFAFSERSELSPRENATGNGDEHESVAELNGLGRRQDVIGQPGTETQLVMLDATPESTADFGRGQAETHVSDVTFLHAETDTVPTSQRGELDASAAQNESIPAFSLTELETPSSSESASTNAATAEPTMLAMAEPQQETGFSGGFIADDNGVSARNSIVSDIVESFPTLDSANTEPREETLLAAQERTPFGSGFDAVTQPLTRSAERNSIKTAAGSGSDGKFSLAAFNYQNNSTESAPDDGSTFDSTVVQDGDNYTRISKRIYGSGRYFSALAVFNQHRIPEPKKMRPGMVVLTPPVPVLEERYPQLFLDSKAKTVEPAAFLIMDDGLPAYRVGERETLSEISERFLGRSARWIEIYRLNQSTVKDPNKLKAGLILALPADAAEVNVTP